MNSSATKIMYSSCPVCACESLTGRWEVNGYSIAKCDGCSLVFVRNRITAEALAAHYGSGTDEAYDDSNVECLNYYYKKLADLIRTRHPQPGRVLDLGCSRGQFLDVMEGWERHGSEISVTDANTARERYGDAIVTGSFEDYPMREGYFDVVTLQDVFDHFRDPMPALEKCRRLLRPGGLIAIKVHNISCLYAKLTGPKFYAVIPPSHLFFYDRETLAGALSAGGFEVTDAEFIGHLLKVKTVFWRLSKNDPSSLCYRIYRALDGSALGEIKFRKNLHDIVTILAVKPT